MKKSILIVSSEFPPGPGGIGQHAYDLASKLNLHHQIIVLANGDYSDAHTITRFDNSQKFSIYRFKRISKLTHLTRVFIFINTVIRTRPNSLIFTGLFPLWLIILSYLLFPNIKRTAIVHGHEPAFGPQWQRFLTRVSLSLAGNIIAVSKFAKGRVIQSNSKAINPVVIHNGINLMELSTWTNQAGKRTSTGNLIPVHGHPVLVTIGHTSPRKGQHNVITALPAISKIYPDVMYYCIGRDVRNKELKALAQELNVGDKVVFAPPLPEKWQLEYYYRKANIFMLLSENQPNGDAEGFGIVALEANYFETPVIGAKGCGVEDAVLDAYSGKLVDPKNIDEITSAVNHIMDNLSRYKSNARQHAQQFDWDNIIDSYLKLI